MPFVFPASGFGRQYQQSVKGGVGATAGATAHTMGSYVTLIDPLDYDCFGLALRITGVSVSAAASQGLADIAIAPTGGGNEQIVIPFLDVGAASSVVGTVGTTYFFPLFIPAGKAVRYRWQSVTASDTTIAILAHAFSHPVHGFAEDAPQEWVEYGANSAASRGVALTSGNAVFGTDVQITASTTRDHRWFHVGIDGGTNTGITGGVYRVRLATDTTATRVIGIWDFGIAASESINGPVPAFPVCYPLPAGSELRIDIEGAAAEALSAAVYAA